MKLLIVEDEKAIRKELRTFFEPEFEVFEAASIETARAYINSDIVLLDLNIGHETSFRLIQEISSACIVVSVRNDEESIMKALEMGAYDYVTKPFSLNVLRARIYALLRRKNESGFRIEIADGEPILHIDNEEIILTKKEFQIMNLFLNNASTVLTRDMLLKNVWDKDEAFIEDNTLTVTMSRLKNKIGREKIETIRGIGYRWKE